MSITSERGEPEGDVPAVGSAGVEGSGAANTTGEVRLLDPAGEGRGMDSAVDIITVYRVAQEDGERVGIDQVRRRLVQ